MASVTDSRWDALLAWLGQHGMDLGELCVEPRERPGAGYGLFASKDCPPSLKLLTIPASALMHWKTLSAYYPSPKQLNATCLISLHLLLHRPQGERESNDPLFGPYISILPREFHSHPLTWLARRKFALEETADHLLLEALPQDVREALNALWDRLVGDWNNICQYVRNHPASLTRASPPLKLTSFNESNKLVLDFVWAWLNVNTRCIFYRLHGSISNADNLALCPILDFANHTPNLSMSMSSSADMWNSTPRSKRGEDCTLIASREIATKVGEELYLAYGAHSNTTLLVEYGFVNTFTPDLIAGGTFRAEVNVQDAMVASFYSGGRNRGTWLKSTLEDEGYWGDWTLHASSSPAHPSFRLITALRLYSLFVSTSKPTMTWEALQPWRAVHLGETETISEQNEDAWRKALLRICETIRADAEKQLASVCGSRLVEESRCISWGPWMVENIRLLWLERIHVSAAVIRSVETGEQF